MWRSSLGIIAAITLAGCYQPYSAAPPNPFPGPSRVASPGTRAATNQDYYKNPGGAKQAPTPAAGSSSRNEPSAQRVGDVERSVVINKSDTAKGDVVQVGAEDHTNASRVVSAGFHAKVPAAGQQVEVTNNGRPAPPTAPSVIRIV
ncbi:MAG: hypothetical protein IIA67_13160 [Planctomycetes bacterium]|nr:hypothetical protein [Planctomycetota bacterium]